MSEPEELESGVKSKQGKLRSTTQSKRSNKFGRVKGDHFTQTVMEVEILKVLNSVNTSLSTIEILNRLKSDLSPRFNQADLVLIPSGRLRWKATARFSIYQGLKKKGFIEAKTKKQWTITPAGKDYLSTKI